MSLYGPKLRLPKVDIPTPGNPSWNMDKEKKWLLMIGIAIVIIVAAIFLGPIILNSAGEGLGNALSPALQISWKNNPLDLKTNPVDAAELTLTFNNTTKQDQNISFSLSYPNTEIIEYCPKYDFSNVAAGDTRTVTCFIRRNGEIFTGTYSITVNSTLGNATTKLEVLGK